jgi:hypothetical protein
MDDAQQGSTSQPGSENEPAQEKKRIPCDYPGTHNSPGLLCLKKVRANIAHCRVRKVLFEVKTIDPDDDIV